MPSTPRSCRSLERPLHPGVDMLTRLTKAVSAVVLSLLAIFVSGSSSSLAAAAKMGDASPVVAGLRLEYKENPLGIDVRTPRFSWRLQSVAPSVSNLRRDVAPEDG
jgi:hypothetical protein